ncbi:MAG: hypothetical protein NT011_13845 [Kiritimatiellaeota bacterium]|nr:hypothetical protein [Kiritimatiellota bacterium]
MDKICRHITVLLAIICGLAPYTRGAAIMSGNGQTDSPPFEIAAWVDSQDFSSKFDTEKAEGVKAIVDYVAGSGATLMCWRTRGGSMLTYPSKVEASLLPVMTDKRRTIIFYGPYFGYWIHYGEAQPDHFQCAMEEIKKKGIKPVAHWTFEEAHYAGPLIGDFNLDHPQYWCRTHDGIPWHARVSLGYEPVMQHYLDMAMEVVDRGCEEISFEFWRHGGWNPGYEYVEPVMDSYRKKYGEEPPANSKDLRWAKHVAGYRAEFLRRLRKQLAAYAHRTGRRVELSAAIPCIAPFNDRALVEYGVDWRALVDEGLIDTLIIQSMTWDKQRPLESTRELGRSVMQAVNGRCRVLWPVMDYPFTGTGLGKYMDATGKTQHELAAELMQMAWEEGADGITLECVDYGNYTDATLRAMKALRETKCTFVRKGNLK